MKKKILIFGGSGLVGENFLAHSSHEIIRVTRDRHQKVHWNPGQGVLNTEIFEGVDTVINLCGASIAEKRWTPSRIQILRESRVHTTQFLCSKISESQHKPRVYIQASGVGYYGALNNNLCTEQQGRGFGFLADLAVDWEEASQSLEALGVQRHILRLGVVLASNGGVLQKLKLPFSLNLGGALGSGNQPFPWIHIDDVISILLFFIENPQAGIYNVVAPHRVNQKEFAKTLASSMGRLAFLPAPKWAIKLFMGLMGEELLLGGQNASSEKITQVGYTHLYPQLGKALKQITSRW